MNKIFIFDIDGTIIPDIFRNRIWGPDTVTKIIEEGGLMELFPGFIDYFISRCRHAKKVYFVTGRVKKDFLGMTVFQLLPIINDKIEIIFYPPDKSYDEKVYYDWKTKTIRKIIKNHKDSIFYIYDDRCGYYKKFFNKRNIILFNVEPGEHFWCKFITIKKELEVKIND